MRGAYAGLRQTVAVAVSSSASASASATPGGLARLAAASGSSRRALSSSANTTTSTSTSTSSLGSNGSVLAAPATEDASSVSSSSSSDFPRRAPIPRPTVGLRRKRRLPPALKLSQWDRVVPAPQRMLDYLVGASPSPATAAAAPTAATTTPQSLFSVLQLARFYLGAGDLRAAREVLEALSPASADGLAGRAVPTALVRPLYETLATELARAGEVAEAVGAGRRMVAAGQPVSGPLLVGLVRACASEAGAAGAAEHLTAVLAELAPSPGTWREHPEACLALLEYLAIDPQPPPSQGTIPAIDDVWAALGQHGPPSVAARVALMEALAALAKARAEAVPRLVQAVEEFASSAAGGLDDAADRERVLVSAATALLRRGEDGALRRVLAAAPVTGSVGPYAALIQAVPTDRMELLEPLWEAAQAANPGPVPLPLLLSYCRRALASPPSSSPEQEQDQQEESGRRLAFDKALALLRGLKAGAAWAAEARPEEVAGVLDALCDLGLAEEARALQALVGPTFPTPFPVPLARALLKCAALDGRPGRAIALVHRLAEEDAAMPADYEAALRALARMELPPPTSREAALAANPLDFLTWAMRGMGEDAERERRAAAVPVPVPAAPEDAPSPAAVRTALAVLGRACEMGVAHDEEEAEGPAKRQAAGKVAAAPVSREALVQRGMALASRLVARGHETDDAFCEALAGVAVWGASLQRAREIVEQMEATGAAKRPLARAQALLVAALAGRGQLMDAEEWLVRMVTVTGAGPTEKVLDAFARAYAREGNVPSGLSMLQGCFTQYGTRPSTGAYARLFRRCLALGDRFEAQRAVTIAQQLWADHEDGAFARGLEAALQAHEFDAQESKAGEGENEELKASE